MSRKLLRQTANEWRSNLWLAIELLIVSVITWYISDYVFAFAATRMEPTGFDAEHVYRLSFRTVASESPRYIDYGEETDNQNANNLRNLVNAIRQRPGVEAVSVSNCAEAYSQSMMSTTFVNDYDTLSLYVSIRMMSPDHIKVLKYQSADPAVSTDELIDALRRGEILVSAFGNGRKSNWVSSNVVNASSEQVVGRIFHSERDSILNYRIAGVLNPVKRTTIEEGAQTSAFIPIDENTDDILKSMYINVRVSPEADHDFIESFNADRNRLYTFGNTYISEITDYDDIRIASDRPNLIEIRKYVACMVFMLTSVFLGLLGTFWFRTQQRVGEVAIRKVSGATNTSIFMRLISEGLILLLIVTPFAIVIDWFITKYELNTYFYGFFSTGRFIITVIASFLLMSVMIIAGIWFPAKRAMKVDPARALADE